MSRKGRASSILVRGTLNFKKMEKVSWLQRGSDYQRVEGNFNTVDTVPVGIYNIEVSMTGWYLERYADKFTFDYKMYGLQTDFCEHVLKTYKATTGNFGIMLTGTKGTGKTVTAKTLANDFNLPVIVVKDMGDQNQDMIEFIGKFNFDCVIFFDEFEKNFSEEDSTVLQIMDGVYNSIHRKIFLLTSNELTINENLIGRPSRLRYVRKFGNLELNTVKEYLDDNLEVKEAYQDLIDYIDTLSISTIDILKTIVNEVNIHGIEGLKRAKEFFNVSTCTYEYSCVKAYRSMEDFNSIEIKQKCSISNFVIQADRYLHPESAPLFSNITSYNDMTEEQKRIYDEWNEKNRRDFYGMQRFYIDSNVKFNSLKVGDTFNDEKIIQIDYKKRVIVTEDYNEYWFYYVMNSDNKPSLYNPKVIDYIL